MPERGYLFTNPTISTNSARVTMKTLINLVLDFESGDYVTFLGRVNKNDRKACISEINS